MKSCASRPNAKLSQGPASSSAMPGAEFGGLTGAVGFLRDGFDRETALREARRAAEGKRKAGSSRDAFGDVGDAVLYLYSGACGVERRAARADVDGAR